MADILENVQDIDLDDFDFDDMDDDEEIEDIEIGSEFDSDDSDEFDEDIDISNEYADEEESVNFDDFEEEDTYNEGYSNENSGLEVDEDELIGDDTPDEFIEESGDSRTGFMRSDGSIVIQSKDDAGNGFGLEYVDIKNIWVPSRIRQEFNLNVEGLSQSIKSTGLLQPLTVAPTATQGIYVLLDGYRRLIACAKVGKKEIPCIINNKVSTPEIPIIEAMYNHNQRYSLKDQLKYIDYLENEKGIHNSTMIEYLLQMPNGDYTKLKDVIDDGDPDIVEKLLDGSYDIGTAFKKLEQRRKKESAEEKENRKASKVYGDTEESGADQISGAGETDTSDELTDEQIRAIAINASDLDASVDDMSLNEMIEEDKNIEGFKPHKQEVGKREYINPVIKKAVMARDKSTCQCCKRGGPQYTDILDLHHIIPVHLKGEDSIDNSIMLCVACHRLVHLYATGDLFVDSALLTSQYDELDDSQKAMYESSEIFEDEKARFKRIIKLGSVIRKGIAAQGMNKEQYKKAHSNEGIGRRKPGKNAEQEKD